MLESHDLAQLKPIQLSAIEAGLFRGENLLVCSPSGSGKTLIGLLALTRHLASQGQFTLFIVPYRALAAEKERQFQVFFADLSIPIKALTGDTLAEDAEIPLQGLVITTYEKCDTLLRQNHPALFNLGAVVFDEIHEISSPGRGPRIELLLIRLVLSHPHAQYIYLSATIGNEQTFCNWLSSLGPKVVLVHSEVRPVPLNYEIHLEHDKSTALRKLIIPRLEIGHQILIFVNRRKDCIAIAQKLEPVIAKFLSVDDQTMCERGWRALIKAKSYAKPLKEMVKSGIAYHNASLRKADRDIVEQLFIHRHVKVLVATTTLAAGVNTPAHTVIVADIIKYRRTRGYTSAELHSPETVVFPSKAGIYYPHSPNQLFQMLGRAGRLGFEGAAEGGDAIILARDKGEYEYALFTYFQPLTEGGGHLAPKYKDLVSHLFGRQQMEEMALLLLSGGVPCGYQEITHILEKSFYWHLYRQDTPSRDNFNLALAFQIAPFSFTDLLKIYCKPQQTAPSPAPEILITKDSSTDIRFTAKYPGSMYHGILHQRRGFRCSCQHTMRLELFKPAHQQAAPYFCQHFADFFRHCAADPEMPLSQRALRLIHRAVKHFNVISSLLQGHFIARVPWQDKYTLSTLGNLAVKLYLYPDELAWIRRAVNAYPFSSVKFQIHKCVEFYCLRSRYDAETLTPLIAAYIDEYTVEYIKSQFPRMGAGDIFAVINEMQRVTGLFQRVAYFEQKTEIARKFEILGFRVKHGVKSELIDLMENYPNISRNKARILFGAGITTSQAFSALGIHEIRAKTQIDLPQIVDMKNPAKIAPVQTTLSDYISTLQSPQARDTGSS